MSVLTRWGFDRAAGAKARPVPLVRRFPFAEHRTMAEVLAAETAQQASRPAPEPNSARKPSDDAAARDVAVAEPVSRAGGVTAPPVERGARTTAAPKAVTKAREEAPDTGNHGVERASRAVRALEPAIARTADGRIDITAAPSGMEAAAERWRGAQAEPMLPPRLRAAAEGKVFCRCGGGSGSSGGYVPACFADNCIEGDCPLRAQAAEGGSAKRAAA